MTTVNGSTNNLMGMNATLFQYQKSTGKNKSVSTESMQAKIIQFSMQIKTQTRFDTSNQNLLAQFNQLDPDIKSSLTYNDRPIFELSSEEAAELVSDNGYFGVDQTSQRLADFVIKGAGDDLERLKEGRQGILQGFKQAEDAWGSKLPDISYNTLEKSLEAIDEKIQELGGSVVDVSI